jgi:CheY-like chemotaxis protein/predicted regulator of Ras-like GTPase activity (Roadblock/LC7/MglB family)
MLRLLLVDDEPQLVRNIAEYLRSFPNEVEVMTALTGEEGVKILSESEVDVLLTDVRLPGIDGIEVVRRALAARPGLKVVVMTAFGSAEVRHAALGAGAVRFLEKPVDLDELRQLLVTSVRDHGFSGQVGGIDIFDLAQLLALARKTHVVRVQCGRDSGVLTFRDGSLAHASAGDLSGEEAFYCMANWRGGVFEEIPAREARNYRANVSVSTTHLLIEAARLRDESERAGQDGTTSNQLDAAGIVFDNEEGASPATPPDAPHNDKREEDLMAIKDHLNELQNVNGFVAAAVFSAQGEMLEGLANTGMDIKSVGMFANNALLNAQKATDQMGVGRGNFMQIRAPQAMVLMRCLNEATDFAATSTGKAHFHTVVILSPEGNAGMAAMMLDKIVGKIAEEVR